MFRLFKEWGITLEEAAQLMNVSEGRLDELRDGTGDHVLSTDFTIRASLLLGLYRDLHMVFNGPLANGWPKRANDGDLFGGASPIETMCKGGIPAMNKVREHIENLLGPILFAQPAAGRSRGLERTSMRDVLRSLKGREVGRKLPEAQFQYQWSRLGKG